MVDAVLRVERSESGRLTGVVVHDGRETPFSGTLELLRIIEDLVAGVGPPVEHPDMTAG